MSATFRRFRGVQSVTPLLLAVPAQPTAGATLVVTLDARLQFMPDGMVLVLEDDSSWPSLATRSPPTHPRRCLGRTRGGDEPLMVLRAVLGPRMGGSWVLGPPSMNPWETTEQRDCNTTVLLVRQGLRAGRLVTLAFWLIAAAMMWLMGIQTKLAAPSPSSSSRTTWCSCWWYTHWEPPRWYNHHSVWVQWRRAVSAFAVGLFLISSAHPARDGTWFGCCWQQTYLACSVDINQSPNSNDFPSIGTPAERAAKEKTLSYSRIFQCLLNRVGQRSG